MNDRVRVALVQLPHCADQREFEPLANDPEVELVRATRPEELEGCELVVVPGTKRTIPDLEWMRSTGMLDAVEGAASRGAVLFGICGGFQMLGRELLDPEAIEGATPRCEGLGRFDVTTTFTREKIDQPVEATASGGFLDVGSRVVGFELHGGRSTLHAGDVVRLFDEQVLGDCDCPLGIANRDLTVIGTYLHGVLADETFRRRLLAHLRERRAECGDRDSA